MTDLRTVAERINTGSDNPETSRALVVFNETGAPLSGVAVFEASMSWPVAVPLPPVAVTEFDGTPVVSECADFADGPDVKGRADRRQISFVLRFAVTDVPAHGWKTYLAAYAPVPAPTLGLTVLETTRHDGDLPQEGTSELSKSFMVY